jgi:hypothetical protein
MKKKTENQIPKPIPPTDFKPLKKSKTYIPQQSIEKKKNLDELFSEEWKNGYFKGHP